MLKHHLKMFALVGCVFMTFGLSACRYKKEIAVIGMDQDGNPQQALIPAKEYSKRLFNVAASVQDSAIPVLNRNSQTGKWKLKTLAVGVGLSTELNFGGIFKIGAYPRYRMVFCSTPVCSTP